MYGMALTWFACFNPRLRTGGDSQSLMLCPPARSFNPRLRTGGDHPPFLFLLDLLQFQSTPPHGRRLRPPRLLRSEAPVSIHASAREATPALPTHAPRSSCFNPRLRTGGDPSLSLVPATTFLFQSTPPHGRRPRSDRRPWRRRAGFNPRLRTGGDLSVGRYRRLCRWFQSTPPHGRRL